MLLYYITDRAQFSGTEDQRRKHLLERIAEAARIGIDYVQLREKDLSAAELESLAKDALRLIRESRSSTRLLINSRTDVALAAGADGVHLRSSDISPGNVRSIWKMAGENDAPMVAVSCHSEPEIILAENAGADFVVFGPVFEKRGPSPTPQGIDGLRQACRHHVPVFALGGVTKENARACMEAGARGIAGIRLFQEGKMHATVAALRKLRRD